MSDAPPPSTGQNEADEVQVAREIAYRQLATQPRSRGELATALRRRGVSDAVAESVLDRLEELRLIDDAAFAHAWVESRHAGRGLARRALTHELRRRGVAEQDIGDAVEQLDTETEHATARALVDRKLRSTRGQPWQVRVRRLTGLLARKGYPASVAARVVREALADEADPHGDAEGGSPGADELDAFFASTPSDEDMGD